MSKTTSNSTNAASSIAPLSVTAQSQIRGGMASTDEEKRAKIKVK